MKRTHSEVSPTMSPSALNGDIVFNGTNGNSSDADSCQVAVVGAGPAGLMLAANLVRYGVSTKILDDRENATSTGRADGLQPKSIETFKQMRLADPLLQKGVRIYDIAFWESTATDNLHRTARTIHYPEHLVDTLDPYILLVHQGMVEDIFIEDMRQRGVEVTRSSPFVGYQEDGGRIEVQCQDLVHNTTRKIHADYLVGCDGAHSLVRRAIPDVKMEGESGHASWGVLDGVISTDFPDLWSKVVITKQNAGTVLCIPRERNMTRLYIELNAGEDLRVEKDTASQEWVMDKAREILSPFTLEWESVEWFGNYHIGQRVASSFQSGNVFITGDAGHTHSPKAAQGMNTSMHDGFNLAWKLNLAARGLAAPSLLPTYEHERRKIAQDLINFDREHVAAFKEGDVALAKNFDDNIEFISGIGAKYNDNVLTWSEASPKGLLRAGALLPPGRVTRFIDANPVDIQIDIPLVSQFRIYFFAPDAVKAKDFLHTVCQNLSSAGSFLSQVSVKARKSYAASPLGSSPGDAFVQASRYTTVSPLFTFSLVTQSPKSAIEIADLPPLLQASRWSFYLDDVQDAKHTSCTKKWFGDVSPTECVLLNVRPDGYAGSVGRFQVDESSAKEAAGWLQEYYKGFLLA